MGSTADSPHRDGRILFLGPAPDGRMLEVMAAETDGG